LCRIAAIASGLGVSFRDLLNDPGLLRLGFVNFTTAGIVEASWMVMLISITSSLFSIGFILLGVLLHAGAGKARYFYLCAFLLISLAIGLTSVSRYETTVNILYLLFAYCFVRSSFVVRRASCVAQSAACRGGARHSRVHNPRAVFGVLLAVAVIAMLFLAVDALLRKSAEYEQPDRLRGFLFHLYWYMASPLAAFNEFLAGFDGRYHLGQYTFFPLYKWLFRFHLVPQTNVSVFGEFVFVPYVANVYTWLRNFYEDFGLIGVTAVPYALGWAASALRTRAARHFHYLNLYMVLLVFVLFSFYNYFLFSNQVYLQVLFGFLFFRYELPGYNRPDVVEAAGREQKDVLITGIPNE
jgi:oligosaccharide repeat unit polymerase